MAIWILVAIIGLAVTGVVALRPRLFWPMLIVATVGTGGLMFQSLSLIDDILTGCVLIGSFMVISMRVNFLRKSREDAWAQFHRWIFLLMAIYMIMQSLYGLLLLESLRKIRWVVYYGMLGVLSFIISCKDRPFTSPRKISFIISSTALVYFSLYIFHGLFAEVVRGINKYDLQSIEWAGTTIAMFPLAITMPAIIFLFKDKNPTYRRVGWATLLTAILAAIYYDSRVGVLTIVVFFIISMPTIGFRRSIRFSLIFLLILGFFSLFIWPEWKTLQLQAEDLFETTKNLWGSPEKHDVFRRVQLRIAFPIISSNWGIFLFGHGFRCSGHLIGEYSARLYAKYAPRLAQAVSTYQSTEGFTALVAETGSIGLLLLCMNFLFVAREIFIQKSGQVRILLLLSLVITFLWLFVSSLFSFVLFYLIIMPSGLLIQLSKYGAEKQIIEKKGD